MDLIIAQDRRRQHWLVTAARTLLMLVWVAVRLPTLALLVILEPFITILLMGIATLGVFITFFFRFLVHAPHFPFWLMLGMSIGSALLLLPYYALMRLLTRAL